MTTPLHTLTREQLIELVGDGLPAPPDDAPYDKWCAWIVAAFFLSCCREAPTVEEGKELATRALLDTPARYQESFAPHIERALGRTLDVEEIVHARERFAELDARRKKDKPTPANRSAPESETVESTGRLFGTSFICDA